MRARESLIDAEKLGSLFPPRKTYLIAVSGGRDSVALLHQLVDLSYRRLTICHLNHQLRGRSSDADARFVEKLSARYDLDLALARTNVRALAAKNKKSIETAARQCRYNFFAQVARQRRVHTIFLAHHADDLVETFLLNLFRGTGMSGLAAMREISQRTIAETPLTIVRPLLSSWRRDIDKYVSTHRLKFREDSSNAQLHATRNRVRHRVLPYLEKIFGRNIRQNIWRTAMIAAEEENFFDLLFAGPLPSRPGTNLTALSRQVSVKPLREMPVALQRRALHRWLRDAKISDIGFDLVERVRGLIELSARVAKTNLPQDRHVRRRAGKLFIE